MAKLFGPTWPGNIVRVKYFAGPSPIPHDSCVRAIESVCAAVRQCSGIDIVLAGYTDRKPLKGETGFVIGFLDQDLYDAHYPGNNWAYTWYQNHRDSIYSAVCAFSPKMFKYLGEAKFNGLVRHEILHGLGIDHENRFYSVMMNRPYLHYSKQATLTRDDVVALNMIKPKGLEYPGVVSVSDYGNPKPTKARFYITSILFNNAEYSVGLEAERRDDGHWYLIIDRMAQENDGHVFSQDAWIDDGHLFMGVEYAGVRMVIDAVQVSPLEFKVISIN